MDIFEFNTEYTKEWVAETGILFSFFPYSITMKGVFTCTNPGKPALGGEYTLRESNNSLFVLFGGKEFLFSRTKDGFNLLSGSTVAYSFTAPIK